MNIQEIANELVAGCREGRAKDNLAKLYADDAVPVEATDNGMGREAQGLQAIAGKHDWWENAMEMVDGNITGPMLHGDDRFAVIFDMKVKSKETGEVSEMQDVAIYHVADGKITREEFFYGA